MTSMRAEILESAGRLFAAHGFRGTSLQDIASDVGCSKASLLYHFTSKDVILSELFVPVGQDLTALQERLTPLDGERAAREAVAGVVELALRFRRQVKILLMDVEALLGRPELPDIDGATESLVDALVGRAPEPERRVVGWMALVGVCLTCTREVDVPDEVMRVELTRGALRALGRD
ncbi:TetR/AcrR family transcriptional regulator [Spongiactinospora sp. TRM90649]|uniref:TetR/AcrR family transcriptional regulator n=1 Tax=Spongiactinospora sp. TRM90649 TaxID=3031114 RepID=UPI0023F89ABC|nr:TetR/AcrR family transcriptional regulator [Spongiactinospora sp. TRM90649]MDF5753096.1 helix-turn-helix domain containing protein [Spongiactinospora sp. TRM90649]